MSFWSKVGRVISYPVRKPVEIVKDKMEDKMVDAIKGVVRHIITSLGGIMVSNGWITDSDLQLLAGAGAILVGVVWSIISKQKDEK